MRLSGLGAERGVTSPACEGRTRPDGFWKALCVKDSVTVALKEIPKCGTLWFEENITSLEKQQVMSDLVILSHQRFFFKILFIYF